ncbi:FkbM family methyltransferase [Pseudoalteromonas sp. JBTF-M23]|uniref:FkbM family methyltransferase n=1 Tax=Pseudoalteromonas caenipelagi TaxID=2726988 RepID=A0A849VAX3_9GAMM|nr:FkbM family methyltransferase [Pseudoalteromonas caenipelagi]NOU50789.1 FkbM family methyltransferase [Pseudoalteromonas caenipelagi]
MTNNQQVAIYGAGGNGQKVYQALKQENVNVAFFIDLYSEASDFDGCPIYRPNAIPDKSVLTLVSVSCTSEQIKQALQQQGVKSCMNMNEIIAQFPSVLEQFFTPSYQQKLKMSVERDAKQLAWFRENLEDDQSKRCLDDILSFRSAVNNKSYVKNDWLVQYFPPWLLELPMWQNGINFVDCGAYIGDTLDSAVETLENANIKLNSIICFEPDPANYSNLQKKAYALRNKPFLTQLYPCGVWHSNTILSFDARQSQGKFDDTNNVLELGKSLPVVALDQTCIGSKINFIKMDIEGTEPQAIDGAKQIIQSSNPLLAISVYHEPEHLWQIAKQIHELNPNYKFKLHCHGDFGLEIILYAIPAS